MAALSIITGGGKWVEISIAADPLYQHLLLTAKKKFWRCVSFGEPPRLFGVEPPRPRIEGVRIVDMEDDLDAPDLAGQPAEGAPKAGNDFDQGKVNGSGAAGALGAAGTLGAPRKTSRRGGPGERRHARGDDAQPERRAVVNRQPHHPAGGRDRRSQSSVVRTRPCKLFRQDDRRFLGLLGAQNRTPSPPPLSSMNSMPAASKAWRSAASLGSVTGISPSTTSARRIVATPTFEAAARSRAVHRSRARAARI
jgi:hypothetical protein